MTRNEIMNSVLEEIGSYSDENELGEIVREFPWLYEEFINMMIEVGYTVDKNLYSIKIIYMQAWGRNISGFLCILTKIRIGNFA